MSEEFARLLCAEERTFFEGKVDGAALFKQKEYVRLIDADVAIVDT